MLTYCKCTYTELMHEGEIAPGCGWEMSPTTSSSQVVMMLRATNVSLGKCHWTLCLLLFTDTLVYSVVYTFHGYPNKTCLCLWPVQKNIVSGINWIIWGHFKSWFDHPTSAPYSCEFWFSQHCTLSLEFYFTSIKRSGIRIDRYVEKTFNVMNVTWYNNSAVSFSSNNGVL